MYTTLSLLIATLVDSVPSSTVTSVEPRYYNTAVVAAHHLKYQMLADKGMDDDADAKLILMAPLQRTGKDHQGVPVSCG